eukprot:411148_1
MKLGHCLERTKKLITKRVCALHRIQIKCITFNADEDDDNKKKKSDGSETPKPLENNFVFRVYKELGKKSQDRQARDSLKDLNKEEFNSTTDYFRTHDRPSHRLFGIYYKMAHSEISGFLQRGFGSINHLMHPMINEELPLFYETIDGIFTKQIDFEFKKYMENSEVILNLDIGHLRDDSAGGRETKIDENVSIWLPPIYKPKTYHQQYSIIRNVRNHIADLKGNYFEYRGLSIAKQLFVHLIRSDEIKNDMVLLSDDILIIDAHNFWESLEAETVEFPTPQLVSICDIKPEEFADKQQKPYLICVLAIQNAIVTLKRREFDPDNIPPNIPLAGGSALLVDPTKYSQVLYWRRTNDPATFFVNAYGEKL